ncbi:Hexokinase [Ancylostoma ceylanicum]|uniref:Phosphotransferase n=1 Tax=Ancylostoma ceylanicum TaxID=53326 RepID=A0A0D6LX52_9BILA|nr:Hexokinase [Ancylostoma ceylanicum]
MSHMNDNMDRGLEGGLDVSSVKASTIAMLPSFVPELPDGTERGKYVAMDLGGTNLRVMIMEIEPGEDMRTKQFNTRMPNAAMHGTGEQLFDYIAKALADFLVEKDMANENLPVGFTFSYPCDQTSLKSATLLRWTKGVTATGVVGKDVVKLLEEAIERDGLSPNFAGTGTNASYMEDSKAIIHGLANASEPYHHKQMIIDTEWGGFGDRGEAEYIFTQYDKIIDERSDHPGVNSLDKLVAGMCMGEVVRLVLDKLCTHKVLFNGNGSKILSTIGSFPTKYISEILQ